MVLVKQYCYHPNTFQLLLQCQNVLVKLVLQQQCKIVSLVSVLTSHGNILMLPWDRDRGCGIYGSRRRSLKPHHRSSNHFHHSESAESAHWFLQKHLSCLQSVNLCSAEGVNRTIGVLFFSTRGTIYDLWVLVVLWEGGVTWGEGCRHHAQSHKRALPSDSSVGLNTWKRRETKIFTRSSHYQLTEGRGANWLTLIYTCKQWLCK